MTGILPIKKYGTHSALNMFTEFSMTNPRDLIDYFGFTAEEVCWLCDEADFSFVEMKSWYNGYFLEMENPIFNPKSVTESLNSRNFGSYWTQTETYEALQIYIRLNLGGLKDKILFEWLQGEQLKSILKSLLTICILLIQQMMS